MRWVLATALAGLCLAVAGCGGGAPAPRHGILFVHGEAMKAGGNLYLWQPGARPRRLTTSADLQDEPAWSPDGKSMAFTMDLCHDEAECLAFPETFVSSSGGSGTRQITFAAGNELRSIHPSWSPDGRRIAVARDLDKYMKLAIVTVATHKTRYLDLVGTQPAWGKPGIAYLAGKGLYIGAAKRRFAIDLLNPATDSWKPFASAPAGYGVVAIAWSSRGELAALETSLHGSSQQQRLALYSSTGEQIGGFEVPRSAGVCGLTWSPEGTRLLLTAYLRDRFRRISTFPNAFTVSLDGKRWQELQLGLQLTSCSVGWR